MIFNLNKQKFYIDETMEPVDFDKLSDDQKYNFIRILLIENFNYEEENKFLKELCLTQAANSKPMGS